MFNFLVILILITSVLLILAVLVQTSKKEGFGSPLGDSGTSQLIGVKKTGDLLEQVTWGLVISLFVLVLSSSLFLDKTGEQGGLPVSPNIKRAKEQQALPTPVEEKAPAAELEQPTKD